MIRIALAATLLAASALVGSAAPATAAPCSGSNGVTVLVQYGSPDGTIQVGCAPGDPGDGYAALEAAGFSITYAQGNGSGAVCRINGYPAAATCTSMPLAPNYWAYFQGNRDGRTWHYSDFGGASWNPKPGEVNGWCFQCSKEVPPRVAPPRSTASPTPKPSPAPSSRPTRSPSVAAPTSGSSASATASATTSATPSSAPTSSATASATEPATAAPTETFDEPGPVAGSVTPDDGGSSWIWGLVLVGGLGAAAGAVVLARRRG